MSTIEEDLRGAAAKVMEALEERARRAWRLGMKPEEMPIGLGLAKAFADWSMINDAMRNAEPEPEPEPEPTRKWTGWAGALPEPKTFRAAQRQAIEDALTFASGRMSETALLLDMPLATLYDKVRAMGIDATRFRT
jgi:DNA-binding NtrC family response regulator